MGQILWEYNTTRYDGVKGINIYEINVDGVPELSIENTACGFVNGNAGVLEIYTTALLDYAPSTSESPSNITITNGLKLTGSYPDVTGSEIYNLTFTLIQLEDGTYAHATRLTAYYNVGSTNIASGLIFKTDTDAILYMNHKLSPLDALNGLQTTWKCYWTGNATSGYNIKINWKSFNIENYGDVNNYTILIGTGGKAINAFSSISSEKYYAVENFTATAYSSSEVTINSNQIINTFKDRVDKSFQTAYMYMTLTMHDNEKNKDNFTVGIEFISVPVNSYELQTNKYIINNISIYNGNNDGSKILFYNESGSDDLGYNGRKDSVESMIEGTYGRGKGFISTYALDNSKLNSIGSAIWNDTFNQNIFKVNSSPIENCVSTMKFPFSVGNVDAEVYIGNVDMETKGGVSINDGIVEVGTFTINPIYNNFLDFAPFSKTFIYLPFVGYQELPISEMIGREYTLKYITDYITGECNAIIFYKDAPFLVFSGVIGIEIPVSNQGIANLNRSQFPTLVSTVSSAIQKDPFSTASGLASMVSEIPHPSTQGVASSECNAKTCVTAFLLRIYPQWQEPANYAHQYGKPCNLSRKLSGLTGFTVVAPDFDTSGLNDIATDELNEIREIMTNGFYI